MERNCIFPDDLVEETLSRLPIKDLVRARCVSKTCCALIDDVSFIQKHYQLQYSFRKLDDNMTYFIHLMADFEKLEYHFYLLSIQQGSALTVDLMDDLDRDMNAVLHYGADEYKFRCYGRVNGIISLSCVSRKTREINDSFLALWNPATREFKTLGYPNDDDPGLIHCLQFQIVGLGFDLSASDFKILARYFVWRELDENVPIMYYVLYSLKSNSWKRISDPPASYIQTIYSDGYLNGVYYWVTNLFEDSYGALPGDILILSFNFTAEVFKVFDLPHDAVSLVLERYPYHKTIALHKERLALAMSFKAQDEASFNIHIWVATRLDDCGCHCPGNSYLQSKLSLRN